MVTLKCFPVVFQLGKKEASYEMWSMKYLPLIVNCRERLGVKCLHPLLGSYHLDLGLWFFQRLEAERYRCFMKCLELKLLLMRISMKTQKTQLHPSCLRRAFGDDSVLILEVKAIGTYLSTPPHRLSSRHPHSIQHKESLWELKWHCSAPLGWVNAQGLGDFVQWWNKPQALIFPFWI